MNKIVHNMLHIIIKPIRSLQMKCIRINGYIQRKKTKHKCKIIKRIAFIVNYPQGWNSFKPVYQSLKKKHNIEVILLGYVNDRYPSSTEKFWTSIDKNVIIVKKGNIPKIKSISPDVVFRQSPYDIEYPKEYYAKEISKVSKLCYIPYGYQISKGLHLNYEYNDRFFSYLTAIYACNTATYEYCVKKAIKRYTTSDIKLFNYGFPRFDLLTTISHQTPIVNFVWIPRWTADEKNNNGTGFFKYSNHLLDFFRERKDISLIIRPHPLMFSNFIEQNLMSEDEVEKYKKGIREISNIRLDETEDYLETFNSSDAMIADYSTMIAEYFISGKPIIYCGDISDVNDEIVNMLRHNYLVKEWHELSNIIIKLSRNEDTKFVQRRSFIISNYYKEDVTISEKIAYSCINEI